MAGRSGIRSRPRVRTIVAAVVVGLLLVGGGFLVGRLTSGQQAAPASESADAGFLRDMQVHHAQAVEMSFLVRDRSDDDAVRLLAYDIANGQGNQAGQMYGLLEAWNLPQASPTPQMTWMGYPTLDGSDPHAHDDPAHEPGEPMPGMATAEQIADLTAASGVEADREFLTLMIAHHQGGVEMAEALLARSTTPQTVSMARTIVNSQTAEITVMKDMLAALPAA